MPRKKDAITIEPMPSETGRVLDKRMEKLNPLLFKVPFTCLCLGQIGQGKTSCIYTLLNKYYKVAGKSIFDEIVIFCANYESDETFEKLPCKNIKVLHSFNEDAFLEYITDLRTHQLEREKKKKRLLNVCVFFDDMASANLLKKCDGEAPLELAILTCRHIGVSIIFSAQFYKAQGSTKSNIRGNMTSLILYKMGLNEMTKVSEEQCGDFKPKEFLEIYKDITSKRHNFLTIDVRRPSDEVLWEQFKFPIKKKEILDA